MTGLALSHNDHVASNFYMSHTLTRRLLPDRLSQLSILSGRPLQFRLEPMFLLKPTQRSGEHSTTACRFQLP
jgi:hypothetical protein